MSDPAPEPSRPATSVLVTAITHEGRVRVANEDAIVVGSFVATAPFVEPAVIHYTDRTEPLVLAVIDGLGGHEAGEIASGIVGRFLADVGSTLDGPTVLADAVRRANLAVFAAMEAPPGAWGMGATLVTAAMVGTTLWVANVGDARAYILEAGGALIQITDDDSVGAGAFEGASTGSSAQITQCLGGALTPVALDVHLVEVTLDPADAIVLCSDGLTDMVELEELQASVVPGDDAATAAAWLEAALQAGGRDNVSIVIARV